MAIFAYVNLLRVMDHKIKIPTFGHKHNPLSKNQSEVRTVGYGGGRVFVPSFISSPISPSHTIIAIIIADKVTMRFL